MSRICLKTLAAGAPPVRTSVITRRRDFHTKTIFRSLDSTASQTSSCDRIVPMVHITRRDTIKMAASDNSPFPDDDQSQLGNVSSRIPLGHCGIGIISSSVVHIWSWKASQQQHPRRTRNALSVWNATDGWWVSGRGVC